MQSYTVDVTAEIDDYLNASARRHGISIGETMGRAFGLLALADVERQKNVGHRIGIVKEVGEDELEAIAYVRGF